MDFELKEEHAMFRETVAKYVQKELMPLVDECDEREDFPLEIFSQMSELGFLGIGFPAKYGGIEADTLMLVILAEELSRTSGIHTSIIAHINLGARPISSYGTEEQKEKYLIPAIKGKKIGAWGLTEPNAGSDVAAITTKISRDGDSFVIDGSKTFITNGVIADFVNLVGVTDPDKGIRGMSIVIVEKDTPGFSSRRLRMLGRRASFTSELIFENCRIPKENLLGPEDTGFYESMKTLTDGRIATASAAVGLAKAAFEEALKYVKERHAFGRPIGKFQGVQFTLSDLAVKIEAARLLVYKSAWLKDQGHDHIQAASMAKLFASEVALETVTKALQLHGGYGFSMEYPLQRYYRDVNLSIIGEGTSEIQRVIISKKLGL